MIEVDKTYYIIVEGIMCGLLSFLIYARQLNESFRLKYIMNHDVIYECQQKKSKWARTCHALPVRWPSPASYVTKEKDSFMPCGALIKQVTTSTIACGTHLACIAYTLTCQVARDCTQHYKVKNRCPTSHNSTIVHSLSVLHCVPISDVYIAIRNMGRYLEGQC